MCLHLNYVKFMFHICLNFKKCKDCDVFKEQSLRFRFFF